MLYVHVQFEEGGPTYAYHCTGELMEQIREGAFVRVPTRRGAARVRVAGVGLDQPRDSNNRLIETKAVLELLEAAPADDANG